MLDWSATWLQTAGAAELELDVKETNGKIESIKMR